MIKNDPLKMYFPTSQEKQKSEHEQTKESDKSVKAKTIYFSSCRRRGKEHAPIIFVTANNNLKETLETKPLINKRNLSRKSEERPSSNRNECSDKKITDDRLRSEMNFKNTLKPYISRKSSFINENDVLVNTIKRQETRDISPFDYSKQTSRSKSPTLNRERNKIITRRTYKDERTTPGKRQQ